MGTKMFKTGSFEQELASSMEEQLVSSQMEKRHSFDKIAKAVDFVNAAAEILDDTGFHDEAEVLTQVLETIANGKKKVASLGELTDDEMRFYQSLPRHQKDLLESQVKGSGYYKDVSLFVRELKLLYALHQAKEAKYLEFKSLLGNNKLKSNDDVIEFKSLDKKKV